MSRSLAVSAVAVIALLLCSTRRIGRRRSRRTTASNPFRCKTQNAGTRRRLPRPRRRPVLRRVRQDAAERHRPRDRRLPAATSPRACRGRRAEVLLPPDATTGPARSSRARQPELWNWDGSYFFDKARGMGGAHIDEPARRRPAGRPAQPARLPGRVPAVLRARRRRRSTPTPSPSTPTARRASTRRRRSTRSTSRTGATPSSAGPAR